MLEENGGSRQGKGRRRKQDRIRIPLAQGGQKGMNAEGAIGSEPAEDIPALSPKGGDALDMDASRCGTGRSLVGAGRLSVLGISAADDRAARTSARKQLGQPVEARYPALRLGQKILIHD